MEEAILQEQLALVERHIVQSEKRVSALRQIVGKLERDGHHAELDRGLLHEFGRSLDLHWQEFARIRAELRLHASQRPLGSSVEPTGTRTRSDPSVPCTATLPLSSCRAPFPPDGSASYSWGNRYTHCSIRLEIHSPAG